MADEQPDIEQAYEQPMREDSGPSVPVSARRGAAWVLGTALAAFAVTFAVVAPAFRLPVRDVVAPATTSSAPVLSPTQSSTETAAAPVQSVPWATASAVGTSAPGDRYALASGTAAAVWLDGTKHVLRLVSVGTDPAGEFAVLLVGHTTSGKQDNVPIVVRVGETRSIDDRNLVRVDAVRPAAESPSGVGDQAVVEFWSV